MMLRKHTFRHDTKCSTLIAIVMPIKILTVIQVRLKILENSNYKN